MKISPANLRASTDKYIGTTAFFRNRPLYQTVFQEMVNEGKKEYLVLFHASSVGAEVYSFVIEYLVGGYDAEFDLHCEATDIEQQFLDFSVHGRFPVRVLEAMTSDEQSFFSTDGEAALVSERVKRRISFLPASSYTEFKAQKIYDLVFLLNALIYVPQELQTQTINQISSYNSGWLVTSAFHAESIKMDLQQNSYFPVLTNIETIHNAWTDRLGFLKKPDPREMVYADWTLPEFSKIDDYEYRYCAIFRKHEKKLAAGVAKARWGD